MYPVTLRLFRELYKLSISDLANEAHIPPRVEYVMELGCPVDRADAIRVV